MGRRVVVTGMGAITPIGLSVDEFWDCLNIARSQSIYRNVPAGQFLRHTFCQTDYPCLGCRMGRRVVVTGMGAITPIGLSVDEFWDSVKQGKIYHVDILSF